MSNALPVLWFVVTTLSAPPPPTLDSLTGAEVEKVASGFQFVEGPAWSPRGFLLFSDIPASRVVQLSGEDRVADFLKPSGQANGLVFDAAGNLYLCQGGARQVSRLAPDGKLTPLATEFEGKRLNSPNDLALDGRGGLYFTDPRYGGDEGRELDVMGVYYTSADGKVERVIDALERPNGILVSADGRQLYVAEPNRRQLYVYPIEAPGKVGPGRLLFTGDQEIDGGGPDGMALDVFGNIYTTYRDVVVLTPNGDLIGRIPVPEGCSNCTFGGADGKTLYVTAGTSLYRVPMKVRGELARVFQHSDATPSRVSPHFETVDLDTQVGVGYGVAAEDMDGDGKVDVVLVDKENVAWYRNPSWDKRVICGKLTKNDHVCIAVRDLDGDARAEVAVGAGWNPGDTLTSGSVHYLNPTGDRSRLWTPTQMPNEPTVHRMRWLRGEAGAMDLLVVPLHGRGNRGGKGAGVRILLYKRPKDPRDAWPIEVVSSKLHMTHNLDPVAWDDDPEEEVIIVGREGVFLFDRVDSGWQRHQLVGSIPGEEGFRGASEVRVGQRAGGKRFLVTIEPFHGQELVLYTPPSTGEGLWSRRVLDNTLQQGHAVACGDLLGTGNDQVVVGWRGQNAQGEVGVKIWAEDPASSEWAEYPIDRNGMACEDLRLADFDGDGRLDIVAAGRATKNLRVYLNRSGH